MTEFCIIFMTKGSKICTLQILLPTQQPLSVSNVAVLRHYTMKYVISKSTVCVCVCVHACCSVPLVERFVVLCTFLVPIQWDITIMIIFIIILGFLGTNQPTFYFLKWLEIELFCSHLIILFLPNILIEGTVL